MFGFILDVTLEGTAESARLINDATEIWAVKGLDNGDFLIGGSTLSLGSGGGENIYIARINSTGTVLQSTAIGDNTDECAKSLQLTADGGAIVIGTNNWIIKTDENGKVE